MTRENSDKEIILTLRFTRGDIRGMIDDINEDGEETYFDHLTDEECDAVGRMAVKGINGVMESLWEILDECSRVVSHSRKEVEA